MKKISVRDEIVHLGTKTSNTLCLIASILPHFFLVEYLNCKADIIRDIPTLDKVTPAMLISAQACVSRSIEENW